MRSKTILLIGIVLGLLLVVFAGSLFITIPYRIQGSLIEPPIIAGEINLTRQDGSIYRLSEQRGKFVVIFFGYTHCPDICPATLTEFQKIKKGLKNRSDDVQFVFITVDPERDTPAELAAYLDYFDPAFIGLTADRSELEPVWKAYGVYQLKQSANSAAGYLVDHSTRMYVVDPHGNLILTYPFGFETEKISVDLAYLVKNQ